MNNRVILYQQRLNLHNATFSLIDHEDATVAIVYKITKPTGTQLILKICTRSADFARERYFLNYFADKLPVPKIIQVVEPTANIDGAILMEYLPGTLLTTKDFTDSIAHEAGALLARIHTNKTPGYGDLTQPNDLSSDPRSSFAEKFYEGIDECKNHLPEKLIEQCLTYFNTHLNLLAAADGPCITHRDFRAGNIIVHNGTIQGIIDWSAARAGFAQEDFCHLEHAGWPDNPSRKKSFLAGYASIRPIPKYQAMMPLLRLNRAIAIIGFTVKRGTWEGRDAHMYQFNRKFLKTFFKN